MQSRLESMEDRAGRKNLRCTGFPEIDEGKNTITLISDWIIKNFVRDSFTDVFLIEQAHGDPYKVKRSPRLIILK